MIINLKGERETIPGGRRPDKLKMAISRKKLSVFKASIARRVCKGRNSKEDENRSYREHVGHVEKCQSLYSCERKASTSSILSQPDTPPPPTPLP